MRLALFVATALPLILAVSPAEARVIYVDNRIGDDVNDGTSAEVSNLRSGPVRSLRRAALLVGPGDIIEIANTGNTYYGSLRLIGGNCSGVPSQPLIVRGNGVVLDGSEPVAPEAWVSLGNDLWRLEPIKKGWFQLVRSDVAVPEAPSTDPTTRPVPPPGHWTAWRGAIYYRGEPDEVPANEPYRIAAHEAGVFLYGVHHVVVQDLTLRHYRLDGINAHDQVYATALQNVVSEANGRSGLFVGGSSEITLRGSTIRNNREAPVLLRERAKADIRETELDAEPVVAD